MQDKLISMEDIDAFFFDVVSANDFVYANQNGKESSHYDLIYNGRKFW